MFLSVTYQTDDRPNVFPVMAGYSCSRDPKMHIAYCKAPYNVSPVVGGLWAYWPIGVVGLTPASVKERL